MWQKRLELIYNIWTGLPNWNSSCFFEKRVSNELVNKASLIVAQFLIELIRKLVIERTWKKHREMKGTEATEPPLQGILKLRWQKSSQMGRLSSPQIAEIKNNKIWLYKNWKRNLSEFARGGVRARNGLFIRLIIRYPNTFLNHSMIKTSSSLFLRSENIKFYFERCHVQKNT